MAAVAQYQNSDDEFKIAFLAGLFEPSLRD